MHNLRYALRQLRTNRQKPSAQNKSTQHRAKSLTPRVRPAKAATLPR
jgi:hypothetical protein